MNRRELVNAVAAQCEQSPREIDNILRGLTDVVTAVVSKGEPVAISGFCKFSKVERPARMGRNPATGESIKIKASKKARITPLKSFKEAVMTPSQAPKLNKGVWPPAPAGAKPAAARAAARPAGRAAAAAKPATRRAPASGRTAAARPAAKRATASRATATRRPAARATATRATATRSTGRATATRTAAKRTTARRGR